METEKWNITRTNHETSGRYELPKKPTIISEKRQRVLKRRQPVRMTKNLRDKI